MDAFGIGQAIKGMALTYFAASRRSGRSTAMVESLQGGDRVACLTAEEAARLLRLCMRRGVQAEFIVIDPARPEIVFERGTAKGRMIFDHSWVEAFYMRAIEQATRDIDHLQREASGFGTAHLETRRRAEELARWPHGAPQSEPQKWRQYRDN
jgi:hypothetical protein